MTANELINKFNNEFGFNPWPSQYIVDLETYANCCQFIFDSKNLIDDYAAITGPTDIIFVTLALGKNHGLMFKNVELITKF